MNTLISNMAFNEAAKEIIETLEQMGFTTEQLIVDGDLKSIIVSILNKHLVGDINKHTHHYQYVAPHILQCECGNHVDDAQL